MVNALGILHDRWILTKLKEKFYRTAIRHAMLYGSEYWPVKKQHLQKMNIAEMRMLMYMSDNTVELKYTA